MNTPLLRRWILLCSILVALMVLIGGLTRLTESGLSIVEWKLVAGTVPPLSEAAWEREFDAYKQTPQYKKVNSGFSLGNFKQIFWLEYLHRLLGRVTGLAILLPFIYFAARKQLSPWLTKRMLIACVLVAAQGAVGWIMVASGLVDAPRVNPVKLALHLSLAFALFGWLLWTYWELRGGARFTTRPQDARLTRLFFILVFIQIVLGALVAGLDAGLIYNTFPLMDGHIAPSPLYTTSPWWVNHLEYIPLVQFQHRVGAWLVALSSLYLAKSLWNQSPPTQRHGIKWVLFAVFLQFSLGVASLLTVVDITFASAHQLGALLLFGASLRLMYLYPRKTA